MSNICDGTNYELLKQQAEDRTAWTLMQRRWKSLICCKLQNADLLCSIADESPPIQLLTISALQHCISGRQTATSWLTVNHHKTFISLLSLVCRRPSLLRYHAQCTGRMVPCRNCTYEKRMWSHRVLDIMYVSNGSQSNSRSANVSSKRTSERSLTCAILPITGHII